MRRCVCTWHSLYSPVSGSHVKNQGGHCKNRWERRVGILFLKVCKQEEGSLKANRNPSLLLDVIFAFKWGWRENIPAHYCKSKTAGRGGGGRPRWQQPPQSHTRLCFINSAWWDPSPPPLWTDDLLFRGCKEDLRRLLHPKYIHDSD